MIPILMLPIIQPRRTVHSSQYRLRHARLETELLFKDRKVSSVGDLLAALAEQSGQETMWFRGHVDKKWKLIPSIGRRPGDFDAEMALIKRFKQNAGPFLSTRPRDNWEWLMLMQHHRAQTRLLDWSESPLVGLYFAVSSEDAKQKEGALWCLLPTKLNEHARVTFPFAAELPALGHDQPILDNYLPETISGERRSNMMPLAVIGPRDTARMYAQMGTFTLTHRDQTAIEDVADGSHVFRFVIPAAAKPQMLRELALLRVTRLSLFPELDNVARVTGEVLGE